MVIKLNNGMETPSVDEAVLFPFDSSAMRFTAGLRMHLIPGKSTASENPIVVPRGEPGEPDDAVLRYYGTVIQIGEDLHMWYQARGTLDSPPGGWRRLCYAVSKDGLNWTKPNLGLVEYNGSTKNNIVDILEGRCILATSPIIYDPEDPDPSRKFKMNFESEPYDGRFAVAYSPDGLRWTESPNNPVGPWLEQNGLIKFNGSYYVNGQGGSHYGALRVLATFASDDFEHWSQSSAVGFRRDNIPPRQMLSHWNTDEEVHIGAGLWNLGNVIIGVYGMWHGHPTSDRNRVTVDLGLVVSNDALEFREPIPDFRFIPAFEEPDVLDSQGPALMQGQGMYNIGDQTMHWYGPWRDEGVRLAMWTRDRLGYFEVFKAKQLDWARMGSQGLLDRWDQVAPHAITCPISIEGPEVRLYANVDGLSEYSWVTVEVLDNGFQPLPGYSGDACIPIKTSGLRIPVTWNDRINLQGVKDTFRVRVNFEGIRPEDARLYTLYISHD